MSNRTFYIVTVSVLMLAGAVAAMLRNVPVRQSGQLTQTMQQKVLEQEESLAVRETFRVIEMFGASYSTEYEQWSLNERIVLETAKGTRLYAPADGIVRKIESLDSGSRIIIEWADISLELYPIYGIRVFQGSRITQKTVIGTLGSRLMMRAVKDGAAVNPITIFEGRIYNISESGLSLTGADGIAVE
jgi:murein DD-endopeptidase MepM/ murein hydrolase activator NlpD